MLSLSVANLITPQPNLSPALPVLRLSASPPLPKSSLSACTINALPTTLLSPCKSTRFSTKLTSAIPSSLATILPKSPTWPLSISPWSTLSGL